MPYLVLVPAVLLVAYIGASYLLYRRAFVPSKPRPLDDFTFTPFEFQADYEEVELVTADGINFGAWHFRQPGSPQTVIVSGGHKGQRQGSLGISAALWRKGFNVILYSYRGWPGSDRAPITFGIKEVLELEAVIAFARKRIPNARIGLLGYSMGAVVTLLGAAGEPDVPDAYGFAAVGIASTGGAELARAAAPLLHPRRRGQHRFSEPRPPAVRLVPGPARDLDRAGSAPHRRLRGGSSSLCGAGGRVLRATPRARRQQPPPVGRGRGSQLAATNRPAGDRNR